MKILSETRTASSTQEQFDKFVDGDELAENAAANDLMYYDNTDQRVVFHAGAESRLISRFKDSINGGRVRGNGTGTRRTEIVARVKATVTRTVCTVGDALSHIDDALSGMAELGVDTPIFSGFVDIACKAIADASETAPEAATAEYDSLEADISAVSEQILETAGKGEDATGLCAQLAALKGKLAESKEQTEPLA